MINLFWSIPQRFFHNAITWPKLTSIFNYWMKRLCFSSQRLNLVKSGSQMYSSYSLLLCPNVYWLPITFIRNQLLYISVIRNQVAMLVKPGASYWPITVLLPVINFEYICEGHIVCPRKNTSANPRYFTSYLNYFFVINQCCYLPDDDV